MTNEVSSGSNPSEDESANAEIKWENDDWQSLLDRIIEPSVGVVPVLGPDLVQIETTGGSLPLTLYLAQELANRLKVSSANLDPHTPFETVRSRYFAKEGKASKFTDGLRLLVSNLEIPLPEPLVKLAEITHFKLFVTTAFDPLLERAIRGARGADVQVIPYSPIQLLDLPESWEWDSTVVYQFLGVPHPDSCRWAVTEEDRLEFYHALQNPNRQPEKLFSELKKRYLLFLGGGYPDWLARFFLRTVKQDRLSQRRDVGELIADSTIFRDPQLQAFLARYSPLTSIFPGGNPISFISELHDRYRALPQRRVSAVPTQKPSAIPPRKSVFLSYAREDLGSVQQIFSALRAAGIPAWFDMNQLKGGDSFRLEIEAGIDHADLFVPIVSRWTLGGDSRYFRREWNRAIDRCPTFHHDRPFLLPIFVDDLPAEKELVPPRFLEAHLTRIKKDSMAYDSEIEGLVVRIKEILEKINRPT